MRDKCVGGHITANDGFLHRCLATSAFFNASMPMSALLNRCLALPPAPASVHRRKRRLCCIATNAIAGNACFIESLPALVASMHRHQRRLCCIAAAAANACFVVSPPALVASVYAKRRLCCITPTPVLLNQSPPTRTVIFRRHRLSIWLRAR